MRGYSVFANGGYRIEPYLVKEIRDEAGNVLARVDPPVAGETAERAIDERNAYLMDSIMKDVVAAAPPPRRWCSSGRSGRQDRHHQRIRGRLVLRLPAHRGGRGVDRFRPAQKARQRRGPAAPPPCPMDQLHAKGPRRRTGNLPDRPA